MAENIPYQKQINWLLTGDPAIVYQTKKDLLSYVESKLVHEHRAILTEGWGKRLIDIQEKNGSWENALYSPKFRSTFYTLLLLKNFRAPFSNNIGKAIYFIMNYPAASRRGISRVLIV